MALSHRNENDGGWNTFMENAKVLQVTLFTPGPSNCNTALFEGHMVKIVERCGMGSRSARKIMCLQTLKTPENNIQINAKDVVERHYHHAQSMH